MAVNRNKPKKTIRDAMQGDPALEAISQSPAQTQAEARASTEKKDGLWGLSDEASKLAKQRNMTPAQKRRAKKDKQRERVYIDAPDYLRDFLQTYAEAEGVSQSRLVCFLVVLGLEKFLEDKIDLNEHKTHSRSPRFEYELQLPEVPDRSLFITEFKKAND
ncbi:MAG: hypothetical protein RBT34_11470 [Anaerolineaceae bacterium]|jgi:hypothetical protein|nr:hypothetical protein [Anaerolineaceae bacterium]MDY0280573.1 hypothetical protein [Salinivirgaceae bacterium]